MCFWAMPAFFVGMGATAGGVSAGGVAMAASLAASAVGTAVSVAGQVKQSKFQEAQMKRNADLAMIQHDDAIVRGRDEESRHRRSVLSLAGKQTTLMAAQGLQISDGTPESILENTFWMGELDAAVIRENTAREAWGYLAQAGNYEAQAGLFASSGAYGAGTSLLSGATSIADQWYQHRRDYRPSTERTTG